MAYRKDNLYAIFLYVTSPLGMNHIARHKFTTRTAFHRQSPSKKKPPMQKHRRL